MRVIKSEKVGNKTIFTVIDNGQERRVERRDLPDESYAQWRRDQAAECMRRRRQGEQPRRQTAANILSTRPDNAILEPDEAALDLTRPTSVDEATQTGSSQEPRPASPVKVSRRDISVQTPHSENPLICKVCYVNQVNRLLFPCTHFVTCQECLTRIMRTSKRCPYCRELIRDYFDAIIV
jgi:hypothetical protein